MLQNLNLSKNAFIGAFAAISCVACQLPHGSNARPVRQLDQGTILLGAGVLVPVYIGGGISGGDQGQSISAGTFSDNILAIPNLSFDYVLGEGGTAMGLELTTIRTGNVVAIEYVNPRFEFPFGDEESRSLALTVDGNLGSFGNSDGDGPFPWWAPTVGFRYYLPIDDGGLVFSQKLGTSFITAYFPGSIAYDLKLGPLHIMPEFKWDPTTLLIQPESEIVDMGAFLVFLSGGLSLMLEI